MASLDSSLEMDKDLPWAKLITEGVISDDEEQYYPITKVAHTVGRRHDSDVVVPDKRASGTHCIILRRGKRGGPALKDVSTNGTLLNGKRLDQNTEVELADGDCISVVQGKEASSSSVVYRFVDMRASEDADATLNYEQDNTLEVDLEEDLDEGERDGARGDKEAGQEDGGHFQRERRKRKLEHTGSPKATKLPALTSNDGVLTQPSTSITEKGVVMPKPVLKDSIEETLLCQICQEIMHACVSLQPCMHSYCGGCYSDWMAVSHTCPACRKKVKRISRNHIVNNLVDAYLHANPSKKRPEEDLQELDARNAITHDVEYSNARRGLGYPVRADADDSDLGSLSGHSTWSNSSSMSPAPSDHRMALPSTCLQCPRSAGMVSSPAPSSWLHPFTCSSSTHHTPCQCCARFMPVRDDDPSITQQCEQCAAYFCHLYWGCTKPGCLGCISQFKDLNVQATCLNGILGNAYESNILKSYLESKNFSIRDFVREVCAWMGGSGMYAPHMLITPDMYVCHGCGLKALKSLTYHYRKAIPKEDLPEAVTRREDCYWGKECRTQFKTLAHAMYVNMVASTAAPGSS